MVSSKDELTEAYDDLENKWFDLECEIDTLKDELSCLYEQRDDLIDEAYDAGLSMRAIGDAIRMSHTAVRKRLLRNDPLFRMKQIMAKL